jgi:hypothetical protein
MRRFAKILAPVLLALGLVAVVPAIAAHANNGVEVCSYFVNAMNINVPLSPCMDDYNNGGALVKSYAPGNTWEYNKVVGIGNGQVEIVDENKGTCVGDNNNSSSDAKAGNTDTCPTSGTAGWGTIFQYVSSSCPNNGGGFYNNHWAGYAWGSSPNGSQWFLNNSSGGPCLYDFGS